VGRVRHTALSLSVKTFSPSNLCSPTVDRAKVMAVCAPPCARARASCSERALVGRPMPDQAKQAGPVLLCRPGQAGHESTVALGHTVISAQWPSWVRKSLFYFPELLNPLQNFQNSYQIYFLPKNYETSSLILLNSRSIQEKYITQ
jgi:hypothetical protein